MTGRERVLALAENSLDATAIAAVLNVTPKQVDEAMRGIDISLPGGGAPVTRFVWLGWQMGEGAGEENLGALIGGDVTIPVIDKTLEYPREPATTGTSSIGDVAPGGKAIHGAVARLVAGQAGDKVQFEAGPCAIWSLDGSNWCQFQLCKTIGEGPVLEPDENANTTSKWRPLPDEVVIRSSAEDFSVGEDSEGKGTLLSEAGGFFQSSMFCIAQLL